MPNQVFIGDDGLIHHIYDGDQNYEIMNKDMKIIGELIKELKDKNKSVRILGDYTKIKKADSGARKAANDALTALGYEKIALFGTSVFHKFAANFIITVTGKASTVKVFNTAEEAKQWLKR